MTTLTAAVGTGCNNPTDNTNKTATGDFQVAAQSFADIQVLRYQVPGFDSLSLEQKKLAYYLYQAALCGRDIIYDQKSRYGILLRKTLETVFSTYKGDRKSEDWQKFQTYCGQFWFSNGNHHHYGNEKFIPTCSFDYFSALVKNCDTDHLPLQNGESVDDLLKILNRIVYDPSFEPMEVDQRPGIDNIVNSCNSFYDSVTQQDVEDFYKLFPADGDQPSWGLNSRLAKQKGQVFERTWKSGGLYARAIDQMLMWLAKASGVAENTQQRKTLELLIDFYRTGDLHTWDEYNIAWVQDTASRIDVVNGFIEVYLDAIGKKGSFESVVSMKDVEETKRIETIARQAQWFEDNSPIQKEYKKDTVKGITGKAITVIVESGDAAPSTPIGINLPNAEWIRKEHGSKSVALTNIVHAYNVMSATSGMLEEFALNDTVRERLKKYGPLASDLHTDMHECIGHASGKLKPGVATTDVTLKNYASCLEEARADLVGLYYIMDQKLVDMGVMPTLEVGEAGYDNYMMNGLMTQLTRIKPGGQLEEAHMRNRALIAHWAFEKGKADNVVEFVKNNNKTYIRINNYVKLRTLFGDLLREIQRIKSEGDFKAGQALVETYGVKVDSALHREVLERFAKLDIKPYKGFIQPRLVPVMSNNEITDVKIEYPSNFFDQMIEYGKQYSFLPVVN